MADKRDFTETSDEEIEDSYERVEQIIALMNLGEKHLIVLNARLQGVPYTQIAAILHCTTASVHCFRYVMQRRYNKVLQELLCPKMCGNVGFLPYKCGDLVQ